VQGWAQGNAGVGTSGLSSATGEASAEALGALASTNGAGVWADSAGASAGSPGLLATSDNSTAGAFYNAGTGSTATVYIENDESVSSTTGYLLNAYTPAGSCSIDDQGDFSCSGNYVRTEVAGDRQLATFGVTSSENWLEDFGTAQLAHGSAHVTLDPTFAATINSNVEYHVFLTPRGDSENLYIASTGPDGFEVRESHGGHASIAFDYRIVAHPKGHETERLTDMTARLEALKPRPRDLTRRLELPKPAATVPRQAHKLTPVAAPAPTRAR